MTAPIAMVKPLVFDDKPIKQEPKPAGAPKPLDFGSSPPVAGPKPAAVAPSRPQPLSFDNVVVPAKHQPKPPPPPPPAVKAMFGDSRSPATVQAIANIKTQYPDLYKTEGSRIELQLSQLLPLTIDVVINWGAKTLERMRDGSRDGTALVQQFSTAGGNDMLSKVMEAMSPPSGLLARFRQQDPTTLEPNLSALVSSIQMWMPQCTKLLEVAKQNHQAMLVKMATLSTAADVAGTPADNMLAQAIHNRRISLQSGVMQAELIVKQLEDTYQQMINQKMQIDQVINVTLPAYKAAKARK